MLAEVVAFPQSATRTPRTHSVGGNAHIHHLAIAGILCNRAGRGAKATLLLAAIAHQMFLSASGRGEGAMDDRQVIRGYHLLNGVTPG